MTRKDLPFQKVDAEIKAAYYQASSRGLLNSGALYSHICTLLLDLLKEYAENEYSYNLNTIKSGRQPESSIMEFRTLVERDINLGIHIHFEILKNDIYARQKHRGENILRELDFENKAHNVLDEISNRFEAIYSEYLNQKNQNNQVLKIANEANWISKRNLWITSIISILALLVSIISLYGSYLK